VQLARCAVDRDRLDIRIAGDHQVRRDCLEELRAVLARIRPRGQIEQRMTIARLGPLLHQEGAAADILGDQLHGAVDDRVLHIALARERCVIARRPARPPGGLKRNQLRGARGFLFRHAEDVFQAIEHGSSQRIAGWLPSCGPHSTDARLRIGAAAIRGARQRRGT
jgi:hypothetical protein